MNKYYGPNVQYNFKSHNFIGIESISICHLQLTFEPVPDQHIYCQNNCPGWIQSGKQTVLGLSSYLHKYFAWTFQYYQVSKHGMETKIVEVMQFLAHLRQVLPCSFHQTGCSFKTLPNYFMCLTKNPIQLQFADVAGIKVIK